MAAGGFEEGVDGGGGLLWGLHGGGLGTGAGGGLWFAGRHGSGGCVGGGRLAGEGVSKRVWLAGGS